jgi:hypothetical protein
MFNFTIKAGEREYFSYRYDDVSFQVEQARLNGTQAPAPRDFRARRQRDEDERETPGPEAN